MDWPVEGDLSALLSVGALPAVLHQFRPWAADATAEVHSSVVVLGVRHGLPDIEGLVSAMSEQIVNFCIQLPDRVTEDPQAMEQCRKEAASLFVRSKKVSRWGEPGELLLFVLIEALLGAPKIATKMYHKTNPRDTVKAADAIHAQIGPDGKLHVFWGEAKLWTNLNGAIGDACASIAHFRPGGAQQDGRNCDLRFISRLADVGDPETKARLADYFTPWYPYAPGSDVVEHYVCFVSHTSAQLKRMAAEPPVSLHQFCAEYEQTANEALTHLKSKMLEHGLEDVHLLFVLLPLEAVVTLRSRFLAELEAIL